GLTLAIDLGRRGIRCTLLERREHPPMLPKMELCNPRTMEIYRRLGIADDIRAAGYPADAPMDVLVTTSLNDPPLLRLKYPCVNAAQAAIRDHNDGRRPREAYQRISQYTLEPLLKRLAERTPNVTVSFGCMLTDFVQDGAGIVATVASTDGATGTMRAKYLVGCDGANSTVRERLGIAVVGGAAGPKLIQVFFRSDDLLSRHPLGPARHYYIFGTRGAVLVTQDDLRYYAINALAEPPVDPQTLIDEVVGRPVSAEILRVGYWTPMLVVAERYAAGRVFLAGDAAHQYIPTGGFGMNTGVGDAYDLGWKLAGTIRGWGGPELIASYDAERRQIGWRNLRASEAAALGGRGWRAAYYPSIRDNTAEARSRRAEMIRLIDEGQRKSHEMDGIELGYRYLDSPLIWPEPGESPDPNNPVYEPTTWPGARLPHVWLSDGTALHDQIGEGYTLLLIGAARDEAAGILQAFGERGAPLDSIEVPDTRARNIYGCRLILLRPDLHVVWRGDRA